MQGKLISKLLGPARFITNPLLKLAQFTPLWAKLLLFLAIVYLIYQGRFNNEYAATSVLKESTVEEAFLKLDFAETDEWRQELSAISFLDNSTCVDDNSEKQNVIKPNKHTRRWHARAVVAANTMYALLITWLLAALLWALAKWRTESDWHPKKVRLRKTDENPDKSALISLRLTFSLLFVFCAFIAYEIENLGLWLLTTIHTGKFLFMLFSAFGLLKSLAYVLLVLIHVDQVYDWIRSLILVLWQNLLQTISLLALYVVFFVSDQGQNLLLNLNENEFATSMFLLVISFFASMNWYISKFFQNKEDVLHANVADFFSSQKDWGMPANGQKIAFNHLSVLVPRMFGVLIFLIPACALVNITFIGNPVSTPALISTSHEWLLFIIVVFFLIFYHGIFNRIIQVRKQRRSNAILIGLSALLIVSWVSNNGSQWSLKFLFSCLVILALIFSFIVSVRNERRSDGSFVCFAGLDFSQGRINRPIGFIAILVLLVTSIVYISNFAGPVLYGPRLFPVVSLIFVGLEIFCAVLIIANIRTGYNFLVLVLIFVSVIYPLTGKKTYTVHPGKAMERGNSIPDIATYTDRWLNAHKQLIVQHSGKNNPYKIYLINGYGGGIRASAYFYFVVKQMDSLLEKDNGGFMEHVISMSTASGSSLGAACIMTDLTGSVSRRIPGTDIISYRMKQDYLSPVLIGLLGGDIISRFSDRIRDRDQLQESTWEKNIPELTRNYYDMYPSVQYHLPAFFCNITESRTSQSVLLAPFRFSPSDMLGRKDVTPMLQDSAINLLTAALFTARFPVISPGAITGDLSYLHDGGMTENSGIRSNLEYYTYLKKHIRQRLRNNPQDSWLNNLQFVFISVDNGIPKPAPPRKRMAQVSSLLSIAGGAGVTGNTESALQALRAADLSDSEMVHYEIVVNNHCMKLELPVLWQKIRKDYLYVDPILPLGWQLSSQALRKLRTSAAEEVHEKIVKAIK